MSQQNTRARILQTAEGLVNGDRNVQYGDPRADFQRTADYWNTHLTGVFERKAVGREIPLWVHEILRALFDPHDVAINMDLLKTSRLAWSPEKEDSWVDKAGYTACGADCALPSVPVDEAQPAPNPPIFAAMLAEERAIREEQYLADAWTPARGRFEPQRLWVYDQDSGTTREVYPDGDPL